MELTNKPATGMIHIDIYVIEILNVRGALDYQKFHKTLLDDLMV